ncbi:MAG: T9SS type A sorting domain-containing protein [Candidatus Cloacimonetes bacterium]|nr:T9SS type A sorting domain-containing protein [Candidatus Cloacimonadota bacterium]
MKRYTLVLMLWAAIAALLSFNLNCYHFPNAASPLEIPTYIEDSDETRHPDVLYFPEAWNGWHYWMSHTPYPDSNVQYENPSIVVSNDGINWVEPDGISNPIADLYTGTDHNNNYNSDSHLVMSPDGQTMHLIWRRKNGWNNEIIRLKSSTDGIAWSATTDILSVLGTDPILNETALSPCIVQTGDSSLPRYMLWTVNTKVNPRRIYLRTSQGITGNWSAPILTDIEEFPEGYRLWHMDIDFVDGYFEMIASVGNPTAQEGKVLYLGKSLDGVHWEFSDAPVMGGAANSWDKRLYRSAFIRDESGQGYRLWYGSMDTPQWRIGYSESEVEGYLEAPLALEFYQNYNDGMNYFDLGWQRPNFEVIGYKVYHNHILVANLPAIASTYSINSNAHAMYEYGAVFAVKAVYTTGDSDPVVRRSDIAIANPPNPPQPGIEIKLYPNPFRQSFTLETKGISGGELKLYNLKGQLLYSQLYRKGDSIEIPSQLASGIYYLVLESPEIGKITKRVLKY